MRRGKGAAPPIQRASSDRRGWWLRRSDPRRWAQRLNLVRLRVDGQLVGMWLNPGVNTWTRWLDRGFTIRILSGERVF